MEINATMVKELRDKTGAGMMDAKKALVETDGNMEKAIEFLRQKGMASADKKMSRIAAEGIIVSLVDGKKAVMAEINCETDFVAKNEDFKAFANDMAAAILAMNPASPEEFMSMTCPKCNKKIEDIIKEKIAKIGEKITIRRFVTYNAECCVNTYIHNGKIGVLLEAKSDDCDTDEIKTVTKDICLHIASNAPEYISREEIPSSIIEEEKRIEAGKEDLAKKPENIREKIVEGRVNKLMAQRCLLEQPFVKNPDLTIAKLIENKLSIVKFDRFTLGEGIEKKQDNFAQEVMCQIKG